MTEMLLDGLRHLLTLLFGIGVSAAFLDVAPTRKNIVILSVFSALDFIALCILFLLQSDSVTSAFYPLLTHMPLVLLFTLAFKCRLAPSVLAVLDFYLFLTLFTICTFRLIGFYTVLMLFSHGLLHLFLADILT